MNIKSVILSALMLAGAYSANAQVCKVQFINNCPDLTLPGIDVYVNGNLEVDDLFFRNATAYINITAGTKINMGIAENVSLSQTDTFKNFEMTLNPGGFYIIVANGMRSTTGYSPQVPFRLDIFNDGHEVANQTYDADLLFMNGCTDAPEMDVRTGLQVIADNIAFGDFSSGYYPLFAGNVYNFRLTSPTGYKTTHNFEADMATAGMTAKSGVILGSGFMNPSANSNGPDFGLWLAPPSGGMLIELPALNVREPLARLQLIHNSADTGVGKIDIYVNGTKIVDSMDYLSSTNYMDIYGNIQLKFEVTPKGGAYPGDVFYNNTIALDSAKSFVGVFHGIISDSNYKPKLPFKLTTYNNAIEEAGNSGDVDVLFMHCVTDATGIDVKDGSNILADDIGYAAFSNGYKSVSPTNTIYEVTEAVGNPTIGKYEAKLQTWALAGKSIVVLSTGFIEPDSNSKGPKFGLFAAIPDGGQLLELTPILSVEDHGAEQQKLAVWPNPATNNIYFKTSLNDAELTITDIAGKQVKSYKDFTGNKVNIAELIPGTYIIRVSYDGATSVTKFIKQ